MELEYILNANTQNTVEFNQNSHLLPSKGRATCKKGQDIFSNTSSLTNHSKLCNKNSFDGNIFSPEVKVSQKFVKSVENHSKVRKNLNIWSNDIPYLSDLSRQKDCNGDWVLQNSAMLTKLDDSSYKSTSFANKFNDFALL